MKANKGKLIFIILSVLYFVLFFGMIVNTVIFEKNNSTNNIEAVKINKVSITVDNKEKSYSLPYKITNLSPRETIKVKFKPNTKLYNYIYVKSVYAPFKVYSNNILIYAYDKESNSPHFMKDPPTKISIIKIPAPNRHSTITVEYKAPKDRSSLMIHPFLHGDYNSIRNTLFTEMSFTFFTASLTLILGILLIIIGCVYISFEKKSISFIWIGLFSILTGLFSLGECNLTQLYFKNAALLYILDFCCFFVLPIPIIEFCKSLIDFKNKKILCITQFIQGILAAVALFLQVFAIIPLYKSLYVFIFVSPVVLVYLAISIIKERLNGNKQTDSFMLPILIIAISAIIEAINYKFRFISTLSSCFMIGVLIFTILISIKCFKYIRTLIKLKEDNRILEYDLSLLEKQIIIQQKNNDLVLKNAEILRNQRHDLRHQLTVIKHYNEQGKSKKVKEYINSLIKDIPSGKTINYCENQAVNALIIYYLGLLDSSDTKIKIKLSMPKKFNTIKDNDLCIIIGNLLENAVEACNKLTNKETSFIKLNSRIQYDTLTITLDNSFDGNIKYENNNYISNKRNEPGIGINSVKSVVKKYNGNCKFETKDNTFMASLYIKI